MRARHSKNGISLKVYAGTTGVMLAFNVTDAKRTGLLGFAIERLDGQGHHRWLRGMLRFPGDQTVPLLPVDSNLAPIQKFRWSDYSVYPGKDYTYTVHGVYGAPGNLRYREGGTVAIRTESLTSGTHRVIFNRAAAASQAYSRRFKDTNPDDESDPQHAEAREWLTRGLRQKLHAFLKRARDATWGIDVAIYEIELDPIVDLLNHARQAGASVRVVYHAKAGDSQTTANEHHLQSLPKAHKVGRETSAIFHQKFAVLSRLGAGGQRTPVSVLTGSTNFTPNGIYRQANVVHVVESAAVARRYLELFELLFGGGDRRATKRFINDSNPIDPGAALRPVFSPRSQLTDLHEVVAILGGAASTVVFCTAFRLHDLVTAALAPDVPDGVIRYGIQNSRSRITGFHRHASFPVPAFLKRGLEGFLRESTAGQRGNILIHLKAIVTDFDTAHPTVVSGSNNFSKAASESNDENFLVVRGDVSVADTYAMEMMRFIDHYRFRYAAQNSEGDSGAPPPLAIDDGWTAKYFAPGSLTELERIRFNRAD